ncbi:MAG: hypothetical protein IPK72_15790 [Candidatus Eisenbacteria bacterium]|nr:hypothetical protein [Candidatus Eisenbacteria bacterium]
MQARLYKTIRGVEARCPCHGHLIGILVEPGVLEIKCRNGVVVRVSTKGGVTIDKTTP